jgi:hypothetical protein
MVVEKKEEISLLITVHMFLADTENRRGKDRWSGD